MAPKPKPQTDERDPAFERVIFFSDGIFAIAITLLTLEIRLPHIEPAQADAQVPMAILNLIPSILVYALSYVVIGIYWIAHHRMFRWIQRYDYKLIWYNLLFLFLIAFLPVPTAALGEYNDQWASAIFYAVSIALVGFSEYALWRHSINAHLVDSSLSPRAIRYFGLRILAAALIFLLSIPVLYFFPTYGKFFWILIWPVNVILSRRYPEEHKIRAADYHNAL